MTALSAAAFAWRSLTTSARTSSPPCTAAAGWVEKPLRQLEHEALDDLERRLAITDLDRHVSHFVVTEARVVQLVSGSVVTKERTVGGFGARTHPAHRIRHRQV